MKKTLAVCSLVGLAVLGMSTPAYAEKPNDAAMNNPDYWATTPGDCTKIELEDGVTSFQLPELPAGQAYYRIVIKAGTVHEQIVNDLYGGSWYSASSGKDISHVIYCSDDDGYYGY